MSGTDQHPEGEAMTDHYEMPHARADECPHAGVGKACRPCRDRFERTPITPDERAAMRALADAAFPGPWTVIEDHVRVHGVGTNPGEKEASVFEDRRVGTADARFIAAARTAVPRLLDALDTAEARGRMAETNLTVAGRALGKALAEVARLREESAPVRPDREALIEAMSAALHITTDRIPGLNPGPALSADTTSVEVAADAVLALLDPKEK